jgi:hypothetical protein
MRWVVVLLLACGAPPAPIGDDEHYLASLSLPPAEAAAACQRITAAGAQGECLTGVAARQAADPEAALTTCRLIPSETWRWECHLRVVEAAPLTGEPARLACAAAGRFERVCQMHALSAAVVALGWSDDHLGEELAASARIADLVAEVRGWPVAEGALRPESEGWSEARLVAWLLHQRLTERLARRPFETRLCGASPIPICDAAVRAALLRQVPAERLATEVCGGEPLRDRVMGAGGMGWTTVSEEAARRALGPMCEALLAGERGETALVGLPEAL